MSDLRNPHRAVLPVFALLLSLTVSAGAGESKSDVESCQKDDGEAAIAACNRAIDSRSIRGEDLAKLFYWRGLEWRNAKNLDRAIQDFEESIRIDPKKDAVFAELGHVYRAKGSIDTALANYSEAIKLDPKDGNLFYFRANAYRQKGDLEAALRDVNAALGFDPEDPELYNLRGLVRLAGGDLDGAIKEFSFAIELNKGAAEFYANRADVHRLKNAHREAVSDLDQLVRLQPDSAANFFKRAGAYRAAGDLDKAMADYDKTMQLAKDDSDVHIERAVTLQLQGKTEQALASLAEAIRIDPNHAHAYLMRGLIHDRKGGVNEAILNYSDAIRSDPGNPDLYLMRAWASFRAGRYQLALMDADQAVDLNPDSAPAYATRARIYDVLGQKQESEADRSSLANARAKRSEARNSVSRSHLAFSYALKKANEEAEEQFGKSLGQKHEYVDPTRRAAIALGAGDFLGDSARTKLEAFQKRNKIFPSGYVDEQTFMRLLEQPNIVGNFRIITPGTSDPVAIGDWFFARSDTWCSIWTKPVSIRGKYAPAFGELSLFRLARQLGLKNNNALSQTYAEPRDFEKSSDITLVAGGRYKIDKGGGPERTCDHRGCTASGDIIKAVNRSSFFEVTGTSKFGDDLTLQYSGRGFSAAFQRLNAECAGGQISDWLR